MIARRGSGSPTVLVPLWLDLEVAAALGISLADLRHADTRPPLTIEQAIAADRKRRQARTAFWAQYPHKRAGR